MGSKGFLLVSLGWPEFRSQNTPSFISRKTLPCLFKMVVSHLP